ncbi:MAG: hypothetical protein NC833_04965 [Candidatus Omnitrophica bacterium]|nr:hypothetical protein [Candidatus Omnitrophota bacterium]
MDILNNLWVELYKRLEKEKVYVKYFGKEIEIDLNLKRFSTELEIREKILIFHYLLKKFNFEIMDDKILSFKEFLQ